MDRSVRFSKKPTQSNRDGGSGGYCGVREENPWWFGRNGGCSTIGGSKATSSIGTRQVVGRGFSGNSRIVTVAVDRDRAEIARRAPAGRRRTNRVAPSKSIVLEGWASVGRDGNSKAGGRYRGSQDGGGTERISGFSRPRNECPRV